MRDETGLVSLDGDPVSLNSVAIDATVRGLLLSARTEQHYINQTRKNLEVVYTFPLPTHAVILEVNLSIGGKKLTAVVMEKSRAETDYEEAIEEGDLPVMVERSGPGLYTANLGNLKPGEEVFFEVHWAKLLGVQNRGIRISIPTVIGKRYGDAHSEGGLAAHQSDEVRLLAQYPLSFNLQIQGSMASATVNCPSHLARIAAQDSGPQKLQTVSISANAYLDRDVVINLSDLPANDFGLAETGADGTVTAFASFYPAFETRHAPLALKILVDCSGSMEGDSIEQARQAVHQVLQQLEDEDYVSYSRFGSSVAHNFAKPISGGADEDEARQEMLPLTDEKAANIGRLIRATQANMGGTEMQAALVSAIHDVRLPAGVQTENFAPTILLITDGDIWNQQGVVRAARASGHRVFAIGVGSAPAESLLCELAQSTGGAFALVSPNESISQVALRMVTKARCAQPSKIQVDWGQVPVWQSSLPATVFAEESVHVFAQLKAMPTNPPGISFATQHENVSAKLDALEVSQTDNSLGARQSGKANVLARVAASQRLLTQPQDEALETALRYSLVTEQTNLLLVHVRQQQDKTQTVPELEQIKQMMAAGHSGYGSARSALLQCREPSAYGQVSFSMRASHGQLDDEENDGPSPSHLVQTFNQLASRHKACDEALGNLAVFATGETLEKILTNLTGYVSGKTEALLILLLWVCRFKELEDCDLEPLALRLLEDKLKTLDQDLVWEAFRSLGQDLTNIEPHAWG